MPAKETLTTGEHWYLIADQGEVVLRVHPGMPVGETDTGDFSLETGCAQLELDVSDDGNLVVTAVAEVELEVGKGERCRRKVLERGSGARIRLGHNLLRVDTDFVSPTGSGTLVNIRAVKPMDTVVAARTVASAAGRAHLPRAKGPGPEDKTREPGAAVPSPEAKQRAQQASGAAPKERLQGSTAQDSTPKDAAPKKGAPVSKTDREHRRARARAATAAAPPGAADAEPPLLLVSEALPPRSSRRLLPDKLETEAAQAGASTARRPQSIRAEQPKPRKSEGASPHLSRPGKAAVAGLACIAVVMVLYQLWSDSRPAQQPARTGQSPEAVNSPAVVSEPMELEAGSTPATRPSEQSEADLASGTSGRTETSQSDPAGTATAATAPEELTATAPTGAEIAPAPAPTGATATDFAAEQPAPAEQPVPAVPPSNRQSPASPDSDKTAEAPPKTIPRQDVDEVEAKTVAEHEPAEVADDQRAQNERTGKVAPTVAVRPQPPAREDVPATPAVVPRASSPAPRDPPVAVDEAENGADALASTAAPRPGPGPMLDAASRDATEIPGSRKTATAGDAAEAPIAAESDPAPEPAPAISAQELINRALAQLATGKLDEARESLQAAADAGAGAGLVADLRVEVAYRRWLLGARSGSPDALFPVERLVAVRRVSPELPDEPGRGTSQFVEVRFTVTRQGRVENVAVPDGLPDGLQRELRRTVASWRFEPVFLQGQPTSVRSSARFAYRG